MKSAKENGFTLIELMVVVVIIGILGTFAIPSYRNYIVRSNRSAAQAFMQDLANQERQYFLDARSYSSLTGLSRSVPADISKNYDISITPNTNPPSFTITAEAKGSQVSDGNLTLTDTGAKEPPGKW